jgi:hypothetical protein
VRKIIIGATLLVAQSSLAQQSFFNTPSSEQTAPGVFFVQEQLNFSTTSYVSNLTCVWGFKHNFELGVNLYGITYDPKSKKLEQQHDPTIGALFPSALFNGQGFKHWNDRWLTTLGFQAGFDLDKTIAWHGQMWYVFSNTQYKTEKLTLAGGFFLGNQQLFGKGYLWNIDPTGLPVGFQVGFEYKTPIKNLSIICDRISGTDQLGVAVIGVGYRVAKNWIYSIGYQHPNHGSANPNGMVMEFTRSIAE